MIFIIASTYKDAKRWANTQQLRCDEWFSTQDEDELRRKYNFHVIVLDSAAELPSYLFERLFNLGQKRGRIKHGNSNHNHEGRSSSNPCSVEDQLDTIGSAKDSFRVG